MIELLLASKSPRRRELLGMLGFPLTFVDIDVEEQLGHSVAAAEVAEYLACRKAEGYKGVLRAHQVLVTADTVVVLGEKVLGKPHSHEEAEEMLHSLSGKVHQVYTGVCLRSPVASTSFTECTDVHFRVLTDAEITYYVDQYKPYDKAGSYGVQEWIGYVGIREVRGSYYNVMGLPTRLLWEMLEEVTKKW